MQAQSDIFLGWTRATGADGVDRDYYVRQLRDWKFSVPIELMIPAGHGDLRPALRVDPRPGARPLRRPRRPGRLPGRLGQFDRAIAEFAETYADQNERDYAALQAAVKSGKAEATSDI